MIIKGEKTHNIIISDTASSAIHWIDSDGKITKTLNGINACFDFWQDDDGNLFYAHYGNEKGNGFTVVDKDGNIIGAYRDAGGEIFSIQPLPNGNILTAELRHTALREVTKDGKVVKEIPIEYNNDNPHECMRMARKTADGYLVVQPGLNLVKRIDFDGNVLNAYPIHPDSFGVVDLPDGHLLYTCMSGAYELDRDGQEVWSLTDKDIPEMGIRWLLGVQLLPNGNYVFSNWMGHGHRDEGIMAFEVTRDKKVVWSLDGRGELAEPATLQVIDIPFAKTVK